MAEENPVESLNALELETRRQAVATLKKAIEGQLVTPEQIQAAEIVLKNLLAT